MKKGKFFIVFEDDHLIIVSKVSGIAVIPERNSQHSLINMISKKYGKVFVIHRIDKDASGLVILAKNREVQRAMSLLFEKRMIQKTYLLFSRGILKEPKGKIIKPLIKLSNQRL